MELRRKLLAGSVVLNVGLALVWGVLLSDRKPAPAVLPSSAPTPSPAGVPVPMAAAVSSFTNSPKVDFEWAHLESKDYKTYIANLRAIGCPEPTIQDIILAELDYMYEPRLNALKGIGGPMRQQHFWRESAAYPQPKPQANSEAEIKRLEGERRDLVKELLGVDERRLRTGNNYFEEDRQSRYSFLSADKAAQLRKLETAYEKTGGASQRETGYKSEAARQEMLAEMRTFMTPDEIFDYEIRTSSLARQLRNSMKEAALSEQEFRAIFAANYDYKNLKYNSDPNDTGAAEQLAGAKKSADEIVKNTLGEERFTEFEYANQPGYHHLMGGIEKFAYDKAAVLRVMAAQKNSHQAAAQLLANASLSKEQKEQGLRDVRAAAEQTVRKELGEKGAENYLKTAGYQFYRLMFQPVEVTRQ